ncbi:ANTAR domain-containing protein [Nocardioides guangzhouensis]|uniref:ANTAR domain-containing protein n=1 Tax=Nocardioides guangzhouensis TaxID=2497878 RepID=A0A4Q4Z9A9_9ACTN|nr:ANTAR domain-containing protein [Nocardioides guangzhouensis]RYP84432.1 ANTAR domain-containing protein [Nocardioides guangzhouensis]
MTPTPGSPSNGTPVNGTEPDTHALRLEVSQLRTALSSRAVIEQAKGMIMAERQCDADEAFQVLRRFSQDTNVPLRDVARALIYQTTNGSTGPPT